MSGSKTSVPPKRYGLRLTQPNVTTPHVVAGWPGFYCSEIPTPVGGEGDVMTLEEAKSRLAAAAAKIDADEAAFAAEEERLAAAGRRPHGPLPFGDVVASENGGTVVARPVPPLEIVTIKPSEVQAAEAFIADAKTLVANGIVAHRREKLNRDELDQLADDKAALKGADS